MSDLDYLYYSDEYYDAWSEYQERINKFHRSLIAQDESGRTGYVYFLEMVEQGVFYRDGSIRVKIGCSRRPNLRLRQIAKTNVKMPYTLKFHAVCWAEDMLDAERLLHRLFQRYRLDGEWFQLPQWAWQAAIGIWYIKGSSSSPCGMEFHYDYPGMDGISPLEFFRQEEDDFNRRAEQMQQRRSEMSN